VPDTYDELFQRPERNVDRARRAGYARPSACPAGDRADARGGPSRHAAAAHRRSGPAAVLRALARLAQRPRSGRLV
jgi:hypothetical protein